MHDVPEQCVPRIAFDKMICVGNDIPEGRSISVSANECGLGTMGRSRTLTRYRHGQDRGERTHRNDRDLGPNRPLAPSGDRGKEYPQRCEDRRSRPMAHRCTPAVPSSLDHAALHWRVARVRRGVLVRRGRVRTSWHCPPPSANRQAVLYTTRDDRVSLRRSQP
jgi:hypothetical protein